MFAVLRKRRGTGKIMDGNWLLLNRFPQDMKSHTSSGLERCEVELKYTDEQVRELVSKGIIKQDTGKLSGVVYLGDEVAFVDERQAHLRQLQEQMVKQKTNCIDSKSQEVIAELANESDAESNAEDHKKSDESPLEDENEDESEDAGMSFGIDLPKKIGKSKRLEIERDKKHHRAKRY